MKKFRVLFATLLCAVGVSFSSCDVVDDILITNTWVATIESDSYTTFYTYRFYYDDTYSYDAVEINSNGNSKTIDSSYGVYEFSSFYQELYLMPYGSNSVITYDAYISGGSLYIKELYELNESYYYDWTRYYKN